MRPLIVDALGLNGLLLVLSTGQWEQKSSASRDIEIWGKDVWRGCVESSGFGFAFDG